MAINTPKPISRDERYLSKIGGNEKVIVPKPISREEKYMYRAAGYDDQPIPDYPIGRNEKYWAKIVENGGGSGNGSTVTFDSGQKFISDNSSLKDYKIYGNGGEFHSTGQLPLTFTAKGGNAVDWVISGNDDNGTENLFDGIYPDISDITKYMSLNIGNGQFTLWSTTPLVSGLGSSLFLLAGQVTTGASTATNGVYDGQSRTVTAIDGYITIGYRMSGVDPRNYQTMLVKGSTAPDHYIPYQQGVGEKTENLFDGTIVQGVWNSSTGQVPRILSSSTRLATSTMLALDATETYNIKVFSATSDVLVVAIKLLNSAKEQISDTGWVGTSASISGADYIVVNIRKFGESVITPADATGITITKGSTAPDHYIPYQKGVGERTKNLFNKDATDTNNGYVNPGRITAGGDVVTSPLANSNVFVSEYIEIEELTEYIFCDTFATSSFGGCFYDNEKNYISGFLYSITNHRNIAAISPANAKYVRFSVATYVGDEQYKPMLVKGSTAPDHYIPYGYQIPLTISQAGQTDKNYDIYIGDSPLTEGETVSKTSTGVDIELFDGENTVSTTLYNKPVMKIETSYGVGVKDNNHYIIPFKVNTTTYNIQIGDSPLYDGEYLSYKEKKLYKYIDSVLTPIDPPSPFPEISTTEGVNKVIIETSTQPDSIFITTQNPIKLVQPNIGTKTITQNGVYNASDDNLDGYSSVTVNTN